MSPLPMVEIPVLPAAGNCCLWQVHKTANGSRTVLPVPGNICVGAPTQRGTQTISIVDMISAGLPCDQRPDLIPNGSDLTANGVIIRRGDGLASFTGMFTITSPANVVLFHGRIELMERVGTHHPPLGPEPCNPENHVEGWLVGNGGGGLANYCLRALYVASVLPVPDQPAGLRGSLDGVIVRSP
jgi:hypothetical protein